MELRQIRYFIVAAEEQNFNRAAVRLHVAQPALSRQIRALEDELGCQLFRRLKRGVSLSPAGQSLLGDARAILAALEHGCEKARAIDRGTQGQLRIGTNAIALANGRVTAAVNRFRTECPRVELDLSPLTSPEQVDALCEGRLDAGLLYLDRPSPGLADIKVADYSLLIGMRRDHPLAVRPNLVLGDLSDEAFVWDQTGLMRFIYDGLLGECRARGMEPRIVQSCHGSDATLGLIAAGVGIGFVHSSISERPHPDVVLRALEDFRPGFPLSLAWRADRETAALTRFRAMVEEELRDGSA